MPSLAALGLDINPTEEPLRYPGPTARESCLLVGSWLYRLLPQLTTSLAEWKLDPDGGPLRLEATAGPNHLLSLDSALVLAEAPRLADRFPVIAVGSNAAPGQLSHKFTSERAVSSVVPATLATVEGLGIAHSAHISAAGYCPYVPVAREQAVEQLLVLWLDRAQLERINETEPNYQAVTSGRDNSPALLPSGEQIEVFSMYRGRWGALRSAATAIAPIEATTQERVFDLLGSQDWFKSLVPECEDGPSSALRALGSDERRRAEIREQMARRGLTSGDGLDHLQSLAPLPYCEAVSAPSRPNGKPDTR